MASTFNELKADVLDRLELSLESTDYDRALRRAVNLVSSTLNKEEPLEQLKQTVTLDYTIPIILSGQDLIQNSTFDWYGATETWTSSSPESWIPTEERDNLVTENPVTVDGNPYAGQTGDAFNSGVRSSYYLDMYQGAVITGYYQSQVIEVLPNRVYEFSGEIYQAVWDLLQGTRFDFEGWQVAGVVAVTDGVAIDILSEEDNYMANLFPDPGPTTMYPKVTFSAVSAPGVNPDAPVQVEVRIGVNTKGLVYPYESYSPDFQVFAPDFEIRSTLVKLVEGDAEDTLVTEATLPSDCRHVVAVTLGGREATPFDQVTESRRFSGNKYVREAYTIKFAESMEPTNLPVGDLTYIPNLPDIVEGVNEDAEHEGLRHFPNVYFYGALAELCAHLRDFDAKAIYENDRDVELAKLTSGNDTWQNQSSRPIFVTRG